MRAVRTDSPSSLDRALATLPAAGRMADEERASAVAASSALQSIP